MGNRSIADCESHPGVSDRYGPGGPQLKTNTQWRRWVDGGPSFICAKIGSRGWQADINTPLPPATPDAASESYSGALRARPLPLVQPFLVFGRRAEKDTPTRRPGSLLDHAANSEHKAGPFCKPKRDVRVRRRDRQHRQQDLRPRPAAVHHRGDDDALRFDVIQKSSVAAIARKAGVQALHANELGIGKVEDIAPDLLKLLKAANARCFFFAPGKALSSCDQGDRHVFRLRGEPRGAVADVQPA